MNKQTKIRSMKILITILSIIFINNTLQAQVLVLNPLLKLRLENAQTQASETVVAFAEDATDGIDNQYDAVRMPGNNQIGLWTINGTQQFVFQYWPTLSYERIITLGALNTLDSNASITMNQFDNFDSTTVIFLEDLLLDTLHNLLQIRTYHFDNGLIHSDQTRFRLHFRAPIRIESSGDCAGATSGELTISNPNLISVKARVVDQNGTQISSTDYFQGQWVVSGLGSGLHGLYFTYEDSVKTQKFIYISDGGMQVAPTITASATEVFIIDATIEFLAIAPGATGLIWNFGDGSPIVTGDINPVHTFQQTGNFVVSLTATNGLCQSVTTKVINVFEIPNSLSNISSNKFTINPNPASNLIEISCYCKNLINSPVLLKIFTPLGLCKISQIITLQNKFPIPIDVHQLEPGLYRVSIYVNGVTSGHNLIIH